MYVYVSDKGNIILRSSKRIIGMQNMYREYITEYKIEDNLIFEGNQIKKYESSKQYIEDKNRYHIEKELEKVKRKNKELEQIANEKTKKALELDVKRQEANEYQRKIYLLKNKRGLQQ